MIGTTAQRLIQVRFLRFCVVGLSGVVVNYALLFTLHGLLRLPLLIASAIAVQTAIVNNYLWNHWWTWAAGPLTLGRGLKFNFVSLGGLVISVAALNLLVSWLSLHYLIANLVAIGIAMIWNFAVNSAWTFQN
ncbi:MAG: GtrA family protein [Chloroflexi bacterium]|nr:GtrA family protein [Chloroflexota bacterium]